MVRGYQKRIIHLKNTESAVFDEAFFLVNERNSVGVGEKELIREANSIVDESLRNKDSKRKRVIEAVKRIGIFSIGALFGFLLCLLITVIR